MSTPIPSPAPLRQLAPEPVEDSPPPSPSQPRRHDSFPTSPKEKTRLKKTISVLTATHRYSTYPFTAFLAVHFLSTGLTPFVTRDTDLANSSLLLTREFYQATQTVELLVIPAAITTHVLSGVGLRALRYLDDKRRYGEGKFFNGMSKIAITGYMLVPIAAGHIAINRLLPWYVDGGSSNIGVDFVGHGFFEGGRVAYWGGWLWYGVLIGGGVFHFTMGWHKFLKFKRPMKVRKYFSWLTTGVIAVWVGGLTVIVRSGTVRGIVGRHYDHLYDTFYRTLRLR